MDVEEYEDLYCINISMIPIEYVERKKSNGKKGKRR